MTPLAARVNGELSAAIALLTRLQVAGPTTSGAGAFGIVGALLGAAGGVVVLALGHAAPLAAAALGVAVIGVLSGSLHIDGLADTADALSVGDPARADEARRDPRVGAAGIAAIFLAILVDSGLLSALIVTRGPVLAALACVVAAAGSRALAAAAPALARGRVRDAGSGAWFAAHTSAVKGAVAVGSAGLVAIAAGAVMGSAALPLGLLAGLAFATLAAEWLIRRRGALDGDAIGAVVEIAFGAILVGTIVAAGVE